MKFKKIHIAIAVSVLFMLFMTPLVVSAIMLKSADKVNQFRPAKQDIAVAENQSKPAETQEKEIKWSSDPNSSGNYVAEKVVELGETSNPNGEYLRVRLVPAWYDPSGCAVTGIADLTDICSSKVDGDKLIFKDSGDTNTIVTVNLAENWDDKWDPVSDINGKVQYFISKVPIKSGDEKIKLVSSVEIPESVLTAARTNNIDLRLDVLADSIQEEFASQKWNS